MLCTQVLILSFGFGLVLLPAVLCLVGPLPPNNPIIARVPTPDKEQREERVCGNSPADASRHLASSIRVESAVVHLEGEEHSRGKNDN